MTLVIYHEFTEESLPYAKGLFDLANEFKPVLTFDSELDFFYQVNAPHTLTE